MAFALGGLCSCCSCITTICVMTCGGTVPVAGASVVVKSGTTTVASGTTGSNGCVAPSIPGAGSYTVQVTISGTMVFNSARTLACNGTSTIAVAATGLVCCGGYAIPQSLTLTDGAGSLSFAYYPSYIYPIWYGGHAVTRTSCTVTTPGGVCVSAAATLGPVRICYQMICYAGQDPTFAFQRSWSWVYGPGGGGVPTWYQDPSGFLAGSPCATAPPASCGSPLTDTASDNQNPTSTSPFAISFTPIAAASNSTSDPVGGSVAIS